MSKITVLIPCYNESTAIANVIRKFPRERLAQYGFELEILVVDNNSSDGTGDIARQAGARVIVEEAKGKGNAIRRGFANISQDTDFVVMLDGDDTYKPEEILRLVEPLHSGFADIIIGSRMHGIITKGSMKSLNRFGNRLYSRLVRTVYGVVVTDVLTGYFAWRRPVVEELRHHLVSQGFAIEMEMVTKSARLGYQIYSVPISYDPRLGDSSLNPIRDGARILYMYTKNLMWKPRNVTAAGALKIRRWKGFDLLLGRR
jgi:glycosyltransferase involved in cell wall biosynthesis